MIMRKMNETEREKVTDLIREAEEIYGVQKDNRIIEYVQKGMIDAIPVNFVRGLTFNKTLVIVDEAQNLTSHEVKTILTRVGENTKIVLTGDVEQIDNVYLDATNNGLSYAIERMKQYDLSGHITLTKGERSKVATLAAKVL